jgi:hypothetical protein
LRYIRGAKGDNVGIMLNGQESRWLEGFGWALKG